MNPFVPVTWEQFEQFIVSRNLSIQWLDHGSHYDLRASDGFFYFQHYMDKYPSDTTNLISFETNYKGGGNKPTFRQSSPFSSKQLSDGKKLYKRAYGIQSTVNAGENIIIFTIPYVWAKVIGIVLVNGTALDTVDFFVLDSVNGDYSGVPNKVLNQFGYSVNVSEKFFQCNSTYDADVYQGMQLKIVYNSVDSKTIGINFDLNEVK